LQDDIMTNVPDLDVVALRRDDAGRYALFSRTGLPSGVLLPWWLGILDTGAGTQVMLRLGLDENSSRGGCWTARDLAGVAHLRQFAEDERQPSFLAVESAEHLQELLEVLSRRPGQSSPAPLSFYLGDAPSAYSWDVAQRGGDVHSPIRLCPDPAGQGVGITANLLLLVLDQLLIDAALARPTDGLVSLASAHASAALRCEVARLREELPD
jgi:hypothetical protein